MCLGCNRVWTILHILWSVVYVSCGAALLTTGIYFYISIPSLHLTSNLIAGAWNIIIGIGIGMLACMCHVSVRRQEYLLYMAVNILVANAINLVIIEWIFYMTDMSQLLGAHRYAALIEYACLATRIATAAAIFTSFLDAQLAFCSMQTTPKLPQKKKKNKSRDSHEQVSDIEYIIPRRKTSKQHAAHGDYSQSWVYDSETTTVTAPPPTTTTVVPTSNVQKPQRDQKRRRSPAEDVVVSDRTHLIDNPIVQVEEASDGSNGDDRKLCYMKSFSRSTSPVVLSASSSQTNLYNPTPIYECLQKLTEPEIYRTRLNSALSNRSDEYQAPQLMMTRRDPTSPLVEKVQYASLMKELQSALGSKKEPSNNGSDGTKSSSEGSARSKNSDAEFSKELEAALQLIQDLESPNTVDTPSEAKQQTSLVWKNGGEGERNDPLVDTAPAYAVRPELTTFRPTPNGKSSCVIIQSSESQSTSGYSSPTHKTPNWSTTSSVNSGDHDLAKSPLSYMIHNTKSTAVISLYVDGAPKTKNVTLVSITGDNDPLKIDSNKSELIREVDEVDRADLGAVDKTANDTAETKLVRRTSTAANLWNVRSLLRKKKNVPRLCPELEGAIIKSESLAYLTENELLARHQRNKDIQRQIKQRVLQQLGVPRTDSESNC